MISIIIPTFNCARYLQETIESVLNQSYKNFEIILVDDGSIDDTKEVIKPYLSYIKYIYQQNRGPAAARNNGIINSKGDYIAFLDADDRWKPFKLEVQKECLDKLEDVGLVFSDFSAIKNNKIVAESYIYHSFIFFKENRCELSRLFTEKMPLKDIYKDASKLKLDNINVFKGNIFNALLLGNFILPSTVLFRKKGVEVCRLFNERYRSAEDPDFFLRFSRWYKIAFINTSTTEYRLHNAEQLSGGKNTEELIKNTMDSLLTLAESEPELFYNKQRLFKKALSRTAYRLAYYYFSVLNSNDAIINAKRSIKFDSWQLRSYLLILLARFPSYILVALKRFKKCSNRLFCRVDK